MIYFFICGVLLKLILGYMLYTPNQPFNRPAPECIFSVCKHIYWGEGGSCDRIR